MGQTIEVTLMVSIISASFAIGFGVISFLRNKKADDTRQAVVLSNIERDINYIKKIIDPVVERQERMTEEMSRIKNKIYLMDVTLKKAHRRMDIFAETGKMPGLILEYGESEGEMKENGKDLY